MTLASETAATAATKARTEMRLNFDAILGTKRTLYSTHSCEREEWIKNEDLQAGVWQVIACMKFVSFLTPDMASKNDASYGIG